MHELSTLNRARCNGQFFKFLEILRQVIREGGTEYLVMHHIHEIPPEIDRVVFLKEGRIRDDGLKGEVVNEYSLSNLYSAPVELLQRHGWFQVVSAKTV